MTAVLSVVLVGVVFAIVTVVYGGSEYGFAYVSGSILGFYAVMMIVAFLSKGRVTRKLLTPAKLTVAIVGLIATNAQGFMLGLDAREAKAAMSSARGPEDIARIASEHPSNVMLRFLAYVITLRGQEASEFNAMHGAIIPKGMPEFSTVGSMDLAKLNSYIDVVRQAEDNARGIGDASRRITANYREKLLAYARGIGSDDLTQNAVIGFNKTADAYQQRNELLGQNEVRVFHAMRAQAIFLAQRFGQWSLSSGLRFKDQATLDAWNNLDNERNAALLAYQTTLQENGAMDQRRDQNAMKKLSQ